MIDRALFETRCAYPVAPAAQQPDPYDVILSKRVKCYPRGHFTEPRHFRHASATAAFTRRSCVHASRVPRRANAITPRLTGNRRLSGREIIPRGNAPRSRIAGRRGMRFTVYEHPAGREVRSAATRRSVRMNGVSS